MKNSFKRILSLLFVLAGLMLFRTQASHISGSDITYTCLGNNQYQVTLTLYRDCSGISMPATVGLDVTSGCGTSTLTANGTLVGLIPAAPALSECNGGTAPGYEIWTYTATLAVNQGCGNYTISYSDCCRNNITSPAGGNGAFFYVETSLNPSLCNNSPIFNLPPVALYCTGTPWNLASGVTEIDGDSLVFTLINPLGNGPGNPLTFNAPFSATNPLGTNPPINLNAVSGNICLTGPGCTPNTNAGQGIFVFALRVDEYRNNVLIGTTMRDMQIQITNCTNRAPRAFDQQNPPLNCALCPENARRTLCPGDRLTFNLVVNDIDNDSVIVLSNIAAVLPGATVTTTQLAGSDSILVTLDWLSSPADSGFRYINFALRDNRVPYAESGYALQVSILNRTSAGPDLFYCPGGGAVSLTTRGGTQFSWSPTTGIVSASPDSMTVSFAPSVTTTYIVVSNLTGSCINRDTVTVFNVPPFSLTTTAQEDTICLNNSTLLVCNPSPANQGPFTFSWSPDSSLLNPNAQIVTAAPRVATDYVVTVQSPSGCTVRDTIRIDISGVAPIVNIVPSDNGVCPGDSVVLNGFACGSCGINPSPSTICGPGSSFQLQTLGTGTGSTTGTNGTPYMGFWEDGRAQYLIRADELYALGLSAGTITDIAFEVTSKNSLDPYDNFTVKIGCTPETEFGTGTSPFIQGPVTVINPTSYSTVLGWNTHTFDNPYDWDGCSNLLLEVCFDNADFSGNDNVRVTPTTWRSTRWDNTDGASGCTLNSPATVTGNRPSIRFVMCTNPPNYVYSWDTPPAVSNPNIPAPYTFVNNTSTYTLRVDDGTGCIGFNSVVVEIDSGSLISAGPDTVVCNNGIANLEATRLFPPSPVCIPGYDVSTIAYSPLAPFGRVNPGPSGDDVMQSTPSPIGFDFDFFCTPYNGVYISTNGFFSFTAAQGDGCCSGQSIPNANTPNNLVAICWEDLNTGSGGNIDYFTNGTAPNRQFVVRFNNVAYFGGGGVVNGQAILFEGSNIIEVHLGAVTRTGQTNTSGIENQDGTIGVAPLGFNSASFTVNSPTAFRYVPRSTAVGVLGWNWTPASSLNNSTIPNPQASQTATTDDVVRASFANGCSALDTVRVSVGTFPYSVSASPSDTICPGDSTTLTFTSNPGQAVSVVWSPASVVSSTNSFTTDAFPTRSSNVFYTATDTLGCVIADSILISIYNFPKPQLGNDSTVCPNQSVSLAPTGGPYINYTWASPSGSSTGNQLTAIQPGDYSVLVFNGTCFLQSDTFTLSNFTIQQPSVSPSDTDICAGTLAVLNSDPRFSGVVWNTIPAQGTTSISVSSDGSFTYDAIDPNGCSVVSLPGTVRVNARPVINPTATPPVICNGQTSSVLTSGNEAGVVYTWTPGGAGQSVTVSNAGTYSVVASRNGCDTTGTVVVTAVNAPALSLASGVDTVNSCCETVTLDATVTANSPVYSWSSSENTSSVSITGAGVRDYSVTVTTQEGCTVTDQVVVAIRCVNPDVTADPDTIFLNQSSNISVNADYNSDFTYLWIPGDSSGNNSSQTLTVSPGETTTYRVLVSDQIYGCLDSGSIEVVVIYPEEVAIPSAFTPNGDGRNDLFGPILLSPNSAILEFRVYNRWGDIVHDNPNSPWDGNFGGQAQPVESYIYYLVIRVPDSQNPAAVRQVVKQGAFTLVR
jgi:gliding motility-associated-like protein